VLDPDLAAPLGALAFALLLGLPALVARAKRDRSLRRACAACGRVLMHGERTCDCE
jgi:hypothetical protein